MPVKKWFNLKDDVDRQAAGQWAEAINVPDLTTRELDYITEKLDPDLDNSQFHEEVMKYRDRNK